MMQLEILQEISQQTHTTLNHHCDVLSGCAGMWEGKWLRHGIARLRHRGQCFAINTEDDMTKDMQDI